MPRVMFHQILEHIKSEQSGFASFGACINSLLRRGEQDRWYGIVRNLRARGTGFQIWRPPADRPESGAGSVADVDAEDSSSTSGG